MPEYTSLQKEYAMYRIERAREDLDAAHLLYDSGQYRIANNRAYYAIFHSIRAVLVFDNFDSSKHSGVISEFRRKYIKEGVFPNDVSKIIGSAFTIRNASDYDDMFIAGKSETEEQINNAEYVYGLIHDYIKNIVAEKQE